MAAFIGYLLLLVVGHYAGFITDTIVGSFCGLLTIVGLSTLVIGFHSWGALGPRVANSDDGIDDSLSPDNAPLRSTNTWLHQEAPIEVAADDLLGANAIANRVTSELLNGASQSIAVVGSFGSGKSSIINLVEERLRQAPGTSPTFIMCRVSSWGLTEPRAAVEFTLRRAINSMASLVDVTALRGLPAHYRDAVGGVGGKVFGLLSTLSEPPDPQIVLQRFEPILRAINSQLILCLEDLDRSFQTDGRTIELVQGLLMRIRDASLSSIRIILAVRQLDGLDLDRICERDEFVVRLSPEKTCDIIEKQLDSERLRFPTDIDPTLHGSSYRSIFPRNPYFSNDPSDMQMRQASHAIGNLLDTPRRLKKVLRRTHVAWTALHGEIQLDELLVVNVLRTIAPEIIAFVSQHLELFNRYPHQNSWMYSDHYTSKRRRQAAWLKQQWNNIVEQTATSIRGHSEDLKVLLNHLFGDWESEAVQNANVQPQSTGWRFHDDYWRRCVEESRDLSLPSDQDVLGVISQWKAGNNSSILHQRLYNDAQFCSVFETFASLQIAPELNLERDDLLELAKHSLLRVSAEYGARESFESNHSCASIWRPLVFKRLATTFEWAALMVSILVSKSMTLMNDVVYYWAGSEGPDSVGLPIEEFRRLLVVMRDHVIKLAEHSPDTFVAAIDRRRPYCLSWIIRRLWDTKSGSGLFGPDEYMSIGPHLLSIAAQNREVMSLQLAMLVTKSKSNDGRPASRPDIIIDDDLLSKFWPDKADQMQILSTVANVDSEISEIVTGDQSELAEDDIRRIRYELGLIKKMAKDRLKMENMHR